jgi:DNA-binding response OmpR family regulator
MKVLLIEDEQHVSSFIKRGLEEQGFKVTQACDGTTGLKLAAQDDFSIIILDVIMPGMNGIEVCSKLKNEFQIETPIIMLTALATTDDIVTGLETGADDYLAKPFKFKELLARMNTQIRRKSIGKKAGTHLLSHGSLEVNTDAKEVKRHGVSVVLTAKDFNLLEYLLNNKNRVVSRIDILENVWEVNFDMGTNVIDVYINYLRKKIEVKGTPKIIRTVIGMGYTIKDGE